MNDFTLPANIKQIGSIGSGLRIYMEDYVCTFLQQYAASGGYDERLAYLVGRHMLIDGQSFLFISGAIYGMYAEQAEGYLRFSHKSAEYAEAMLEEHFPGQEVVGWMQSQPSYGTYLNQRYAAYHLRQFTKPYQVLFVMDPLERVNAFYAANPNAVTPADRLADVGGYFIYYEKNVNMHEYMLTNKTADYPPPPTFVELTTVEGVPDEYDTLQGMHEDYEDDHNEITTHHIANPEEVIRRHRVNRLKRRGLRADQKRPSSLLAGLCAVLFVVSFVMGVGLIRNQDRIDRMEGEIRQLVTAHRNLFAQISNLEFAPVFAETNPPVVPESSAHFDTHVYDTATPEEVVEAQPPVQPAPPSAEPVYLPQPEPLPSPEPLPQAYYYSEAAMPSIPATYTIRPGDSLLGISLYFFGNVGMVEEIMALNGLEDPDHIVAGRTIALPQR
ncbi:MAG: LysM peptidoglycan-binding domain-containing protein [Firmicutes bacterium]|nr:LysM peptidoglycan-binding domain-containing protein [Bacillota bacterium]